MKRSEAVACLLKHGEIVQWGNQCDDGAYNKLVEQGFCELDGAFFKATAATPLAMLTPTQLLCAQQLAEAGGVSHGAVPREQLTYMWKLADGGWAGAPCGYTDWEWKATQELVEAIECWIEAKEGNR